MSDITRQTVDRHTRKQTGRQTDGKHTRRQKGRQAQRKTKTIETHGDSQVAKVLTERLQTQTETERQTYSKGDSQVDSQTIETHGDSQVDKVDRETADTEGDWQEADTQGDKQAAGTQGDRQTDGQTAADWQTDIQTNKNRCTVNQTKRSSHEKYINCGDTNT